LSVPCMFVLFYRGVLTSRFSKLKKFIMTGAHHSSQSPKKDNESAFVGDSNDRLTVVCLVCLNTRVLQS